MSTADYLAHNPNGSGRTSPQMQQQDDSAPMKPTNPTLQPESNDGRYSPSSTTLTKQPHVSEVALPRWSILSFFLLGLSSWIAINGSFTEIPVFGPVVPEGYNIASDMTFAVQAANFVPLCILIVRFFGIFGSGDGTSAWDARVISTILPLNIAACIVMAVVWEYTWGGNSVPMLIVLSVMGIVDCTSSITFWPYVKKWSAHLDERNRRLLIIALSTGESSTGFVVAVLGAAQTVNADQPRYSAGVFFALCAIISFFSLLGFIYLQQNRIPEPDSIASSPIPSDPESPLQSPVVVQDAVVVQIAKAAEAVSLKRQHPQPLIKPTQSWSLLIMKHWPQFLLLFILNFWENGPFVSLLPNGTRPFGEKVYQWSTYLPLALAAVTVGLARLRHQALSTGTSVILTLIASICMIGIIVPSTGHISHPQEDGMHFLVVFNASVTKMAIALAKTGCMLALEQSAEGMFLAGLSIQSGSLVGSILFWALINKTKYFG